MSESQLRNDIDYMIMEYDAPIEVEKKGRTKYYYYANKNYSIWNLPLGEEDLKLLTGAVQLLKQLNGFEIADQIGGIVQMLEQRIQPVEKNNYACISFENPPPALGYEYLEDLYKAIVQKNVLLITYKSFVNKVSEVMHIHPYFLKEYNNRWYLFGWVKETKRLENRALDRMISIKVTAGKFVPNTFFDPLTYFDNCIGTTKHVGKAIETIELCISKTKSPYVLSKRLHQSQSLLYSYQDGSVLIALNILINPELKNLLLSFGKDVEVKKPEHLRKEMKELLQAAVESYK